MDEEELVLVLEPDGNSSRQSVDCSSSDTIPGESEQTDVMDGSATRAEEANNPERPSALDLNDNKSKTIPQNNHRQHDACESANQSISPEKETETTNKAEELILQLDTTKEEKRKSSIQEQQQPRLGQEEAVESGRGKDKNKGEDGQAKQSATPDRISPLSTSSTSELYSDGSSSTVEVYEVEAIMGHKLVKGKTFFKVRWQNFGPKDDTWEPEENLATNPILTKTIENYWEQKKVEKQKREEVKKESPKQHKGMDEVVEDKGEDGDETTDSSWYGIKPDEGSKEIRRLFVADRVPTETEKKLAEIKPGVRVLRNHLRNQTATDSVKSESPMPERKPSKRSQAATAAAARKRAAASKKPSESSDTLHEDTPPVRVERRGRPPKKPKEGSATSSSKDDDMTSSCIKTSPAPKGVFTCEDNTTTTQPAEPKQPSEQPANVTDSKPKEEPFPETKPSRKRTRHTDHSQEKAEKCEEGPSGSGQQTKTKATSSHHFAGSARPALTTARPPATLTKVKLEAMKRPLQRTSEEQIASSRKSGSLPSSMKPSTSSPAKQIAKPPMDDKWTAKQKRLYSLDLPMEVTKAKDVGEWIGQQANTKMDSIQLTQEEFEEAVMDGKVDRVRAALREEKGRLDVNEVDTSGRTLLHKVELHKSMLQNVFLDPNPLISGQNNCWLLRQLVEEKGATLQGWYISYKAEDILVLRWCVQVCEVKCGVTHTQCELIDILVTNGGRMDARETTNGQTPLHVAIANRRLCHVRKLLALRSPVNLPDYSDQPPIVTAFNCSDADFINALLNAGATFQPAFRAKPATNKHLLKRVLSHQTRLQTSFDKARQTITSNMIANPVSPIFVNPLYEAREIEHSFRVDDVTLPGPHCAYMVFTCLCDFSTDRLDSRMWSSSPVVRISINNRDCRLLQEKSKFVFLAALRNGFNMLNIELNASQCDSNDLKLLTQVCLVQLQKAGNAQHTHRPVAPVQPTIQHNLAAGSGGI